MNHKRVIKIALNIILVLMVLVGGLGFAMAGENSIAADDVPELYLVKDIRTGVDSSEPVLMTNVNGTLFFNANDGVHGWELWKSYGTADSTVMVKDIFPGIDSNSFPNYSYPNRLTSMDGTLFFAADDGVHGRELWKSDGTADGTVMVKDIRPGNYGSSPSQLTDMNDKFFFSANDGLHGGGLWKSDGTADGTVMVKDISPLWLTTVGNTLFFSADDGVHGYELWKSDGTAEGTVLVKDILPGDRGFWPAYLTESDGNLFFCSYEDPCGYELWKSDGTADGTVKVKDVSLSFLTDVNGTLFFSGYSGGDGYALWKSDGTTEGTVVVKDISAAFMAEVNGTLFFGGYEGVHGRELWKSDGTTEGTVLVKDILPGEGGSDPRDLTDVDGTLFFSLFGGNGLWMSDGTADGTVLVKASKLITSEHPSGDHKLVTQAASTLFFSADDGTHGMELWALRVAPICPPCVHLPIIQ